MEAVVEGDGDLDSVSFFVGSDDDVAGVVEGLDLFEGVGEGGVTVVLEEEADLRAKAVAAVAKGEFLLGAGDGVGGGHGGASGDVFDVEVEGWGRGQGIFDLEGAGGQAGEAGEVVAVVGRGVVGAEAAETELGGGETGGGEVELGIAPGLETLVDDGDEVGGEACLVLKDGLALLVVLDGDEGEGGILGDGLFDIGEGEHGGVEGGVCGADGVDLG